MRQHLRRQCAHLHARPVKVLCLTSLMGKLHRQRKLLKL